MLSIRCESVRTTDHKHITCEVSLHIMFKPFTSRITLNIVRVDDLAMLDLSLKLQLANWVSSQMERSRTRIQQFSCVPLNRLDRPFERSLNTVNMDMHLFVCFLLADK